MSKIYLIGSLRNPSIPELAKRIQSEGFSVFSDWFAAGPEADDYWKKYEQAMGHTYEEALEGYACNHVFDFDRKHLEESDAVILAMPAGKSAHLELGYAIGRGIPGYIYLDSPDRWDAMTRFCNKASCDLEKIIADIKQVI